MNITTEIKEVLRINNIEFKAHYLGLKTDSDFNGDVFTVTFTKKGKFAGFPYTLGTGHRKNNRPTPPRVECVLHSLLIDSQCIEAGFQSFCDDMGCNSDSIKDKTLFDSCVKQSKELTGFFSTECIEAFKIILEEY